jgi:hypothetical protein
VALGGGSATPWTEKKKKIRQDRFCPWGWPRAKPIFPNFYFFIFIFLSRGWPTISLAKMGVIGHPMVAKGVAQQPPLFFLIFLIF